MVVGVLKLSLVIPENHSLKGKRGVLKRIEARVSNQFNISVTECGDQDLWQSAILGFGVVGSSQPILSMIWGSPSSAIPRSNSFTASVVS
ncbi:MAG: DUF503 domain-containing protein [Deltaproteobacteria bacterium]|nr:DUF503 domain-containing protein [Deltaproteobacteria bacterium]